MRPTRPIDHQRTHPVRAWISILAGLALLVTAIAACSSSDDAGSTAVADAGFDGEDAAVDAVDESYDGDVDAAEEAQPSVDVIEDTGSEAESGDEAASDDAAASGQTGDAATSLGSAGAVPTQQSAADFGREIIFTADITVEVDDVAAAGREATTIIEGVGGFVFGQETQGGNQPRSVLVYKVLPDDFDRAVEALGSVGELRNQVVSADDVTERVVDLRTRIEVAELGVDRLRETLTGTQNLQDYAELERLLLERETELELMRGQLRTLQDRIDLATITLTLVQDAINHSIVVDASVYHTQDGGVSCPGNDEWYLDAGTEVTLCLEIVNTGEEPVADLAVIDTALGIDSADQLLAVYGDLSRLEPGQSVMLAYETTPERSVRVRTKVTARPITEDGESAGPPIDATVQGDIQVAPSDDDPGFGEGFDAGVAVLQGIWTVIKVVVGFALPLLVLLVIASPLLWWAGRTLRTRRRRGAEERMAATPPPPAYGPSPAAPNPPAPSPGATPSTDRPDPGTLTDTSDS